MVLMVDVAVFKILQFAVFLLIKGEAQKQSLNLLVFVVLVVASVKMNHLFQPHLSAP